MMWCSAAGRAVVLVGDVRKKQDSIALSSCVLQAML